METYLTKKENEAKDGCLSTVTEGNHRERTNKIMENCRESVEDLNLKELKELSGTKEDNILDDNIATSCIQGQVGSEGFSRSIGNINGGIGLDISNSFSEITPDYDKERLSKRLSIEKDLQIGLDKIISKSENRGFEDVTLLEEIVSVNNNHKEDSYSNDNAQNNDATHKENQTADEEIEQVCFVSLNKNNNKKTYVLTKNEESKSINGIVDLEKVSENFNEERGQKESIVLDSVMFDDVKQNGMVEKEVENTVDMQETIEGVRNVEENSMTDERIRVGDLIDVMKDCEDIENVEDLYKFGNDLVNTMKEGDAGIMIYDQTDIGGDASEGSERIEDSEGRNLDIDLYKAGKKRYKIKEVGNFKDREEPNITIDIVDKIEIEQTFVNEKTEDELNSAIVESRQKPVIDSAETLVLLESFGESGVNETNNVGIISENKCPIAKFDNDLVETILNSKGKKEAVTSSDKIGRLGVEFEGKDKSDLSSVVQESMQRKTSDVEAKDISSFIDVDNAMTEMMVNIYDARSDIKELSGNINENVIRHLDINEESELSIDIENDGTYKEIIGKHEQDETSVGSVKIVVDEIIAEMIAKVFEYAEMSCNSHEIKKRDRGEESAEIIEIETPGTDNVFFDLLSHVDKDGSQMGQKIMQESESEVVRVRKDVFKHDIRYNQEERNVQEESDLNYLHKDDNAEQKKSDVQGLILEMIDSLYESNDTSKVVVTKLDQIHKNIFDDIGLTTEMQHEKTKSSKSEQYTDKFTLENSLESRFELEEVREGISRVNNNEKVENINEGNHKVGKTSLLYINSDSHKIARERDEGEIIREEKVVSVGIIGNDRDLSEHAKLKKCTEVANEMVKTRHNEIIEDGYRAEKEIKEMTETKTTDKHEKENLTGKMELTKKERKSKDDHEPSVFIFDEEVVERIEKKSNSFDGENKKWLTFDIACKEKENHNSREKISDLNQSFTDKISKENAEMCIENKDKVITFDLGQNNETVSDSTGKIVGDVMNGLVEIVKENGVTNQYGQGSDVVKETKADVDNVFEDVINHMGEKYSKIDITRAEIAIITEVDNGKTNYPADNVPRDEKSEKEYKDENEVGHGKGKTDYADENLRRDKKCKGDKSVMKVEEYRIKTICNVEDNVRQIDKRNIDHVSEFERGKVKSKINNSDEKVGGEDEGKIDFSAKSLGGEDKRMTENAAVIVGEEDKIKIDQAVENKGVNNGFMTYGAADVIGVDDKVKIDNAAQNMEKDEKRKYFNFSDNLRRDPYAEIEHPSENVRVNLIAKIDHVVDNVGIYDNVKIAKNAEIVREEDKIKEENAAENMDRDNIRATDNPADNERRDEKDEKEYPVDNAEGGDKAKSNYVDKNAEADDKDKTDLAVNIGKVPGNFKPDENSEKKHLVENVEVVENVRTDHADATVEGDETDYATDNMIQDEKSKVDISDENVVVDDNFKTDHADENVGRDENDKTGLASEIGGVNDTVKGYLGVEGVEGVTVDDEGKSDHAAQNLVGDDNRKIDNATENVIHEEKFKIELSTENFVADDNVKTDHTDENAERDENTKIAFAAEMVGGYDNDKVDNASENIEGENKQKTEDDSVDVSLDEKSEQEHSIDKSKREDFLPIGYVGENFGENDKGTKDYDAGKDEEGDKVKTDQHTQNILVNDKVESDNAIESVGENDEPKIDHVAQNMEKDDEGKSDNSGNNVKQDKSFEIANSGKIIVADDIVKTDHADGNVERDENAKTALVAEKIGVDNSDKTDDAVDNFRADDEGTIHHSAQNLEGDDYRINDYAADNMIQDEKSKVYISDENVVIDDNVKTDHADENFEEDKNGKTSLAAEMAGVDDDFKADNSSENKEGENKQKTADVSVDVRLDEKSEKEHSIDTCQIDDLLTIDYACINVGENDNAAKNYDAEKDEVGDKIKTDQPAEKVLVNEKVESDKAVENIDEDGEAKTDHATQNMEKDDKRKTPNAADNVIPDEKSKIELSTEKIAVADNVKRDHVEKNVARDEHDKTTLDSEIDGVDDKIEGDHVVKSVRVDYELKRDLAAQNMEGDDNRKIGNAADNVKEDEKTELDYSDDKFEVDDFPETAFAGKNFGGDGNSTSYCAVIKFEVDYNIKRGQAAETTKRDDKRKTDYAANNVNQDENAEIEHSAVYVTVDDNVKTDHAYENMEEEEMHKIYGDSNDFKREEKSKKEHYAKIVEGDDLFTIGHDGGNAREDDKFAIDCDYGKDEVDNKVKMDKAAENVGFHEKVGVGQAFESVDNVFNNVRQDEKGECEYSVENMNVDDKVQRDHTDENVEGVIYTFGKELVDGIMEVEAAGNKDAVFQKDTKDDKDSGYRKINLELKKIQVLDNNTGEDHVEVSSHCDAKSIHHDVLLDPAELEGIFPPEKDGITVTKEEEISNSLKEYVRRDKTKDHMDDSVVSKSLKESYIGGHFINEKKFGDFINSEDKANFHISRLETGMKLQIFNNNIIDIFAEDDRKDDIEHIEMIVTEKVDSREKCDGTVRYKTPTILKSKIGKVTEEREKKDIKYKIKLNGIHGRKKYENMSLVNDDKKASARMIFRDTEYINCEKPKILQSWTSYPDQNKKEPKKIPRESTKLISTPKIQNQYPNNSVEISRSPTKYKPNRFYTTVFQTKKTAERIDEPRPIERSKKKNLFTLDQEKIRIKTQRSPLVIERQIPMPMRNDSKEDADKGGPTTQAGFNCSSNFLRSQESEFKQIKLCFEEMKMKIDRNHREKMKFVPDVYNNLEPYTNTKVYEIVRNQSTHPASKAKCRATAINICDPWENLKMDKLPQLPSRDPQTNLTSRQPTMLHQKARTTLTSLLDSLELGKQNNHQMRLSRSANCSFRCQETKTRIEARRIEQDYEQTKTELCRLSLHKTKATARGINDDHMESVFSAYLQNSAGSRKALQEALQSSNKTKLNVS